MSIRTAWSIDNIIFVILRKLLQYVAIILAFVCYKFIVKLKFNLKQSKILNITKVEVLVEK